MMWPHFGNPDVCLGGGAVGSQPRRSGASTGERSRVSGSARYIEEEHSAMWLIQDLTAFEGWRAGGNMTGDLDNRGIGLDHVKGHGAPGDCLAPLKGGATKMKDSPTVSRPLRGAPKFPMADSWGGRFVRRADRPKWFIDDPDPSPLGKKLAGQRRDRCDAKTLSKYRAQWLRGWHARMDRCKQARP